MKKRICQALVSIILISACMFYFFNIKTTTKQCINYQCHVLEIPVYLKTLDFFDRHYNYKNLVESITRDTKSDEGCVTKILQWTQDNIIKAPEGLPIIDDHVWHIIVRGYGVDDQLQDVFTTLCNYAKIDAFFFSLQTSNNNEKKPLSFVRLSQKWYVFDAYNGVYFKNSKGEMASVEDLSSGNWQAVSLLNRGIPPYYADYFRNLGTINYKDWKLSRAAIQSPLNRFFFWKKTNR